MWGMPLHLGWRTQIARHGLLGPRFSIASAIFDGPNPVWKGSVVVTNANEARDAVREAKSAGYDFIKVYERLSKEAYLAIADEAKTQGVPFAGHVPLAVTTAEASAAGQRSIEHLSSVLYGTSSSEAESRPKAAQLSTGNEASVPMTVERRAALRAITETVLATYDKDKAAALFGAFVKNDTWQCPTLVVLRAFANLDDPAFTRDPRLKYMPRTIRDSWNPASDARTSTRTPEDYASGRRLFRRQLEVVDLMQKNGVRLLAGTDALNPFAFPGFSLHDELQLMVQAGLSPLEALRTATINPAIFLGRTDQLGAIEAGKLADLVLLDANPLDGITNTTRIALVVADGRVFTRADLDGMLAQAEKTANAGTSDRE
jgi:imidazolonepropionase-like amidohydrolase